MRSRIVTLSLLAAAALQPAQDGPRPCDSSPFIVRNVDVWTASRPLRRRDVIVRDGRIAAIEPARGDRNPAVTIVDGTGHTLLPGLVDLHLHFTIPGGLLPGEGMRARLESISAQQLLRSGVTSGRLHLATLDDAVRLKARSADPCAPMPRVQVGGPGLSGATDRDSGNFQGAKSRDDAVAKIERFRSAGVDWVAIHDAHRFQPDVLEAIGAAARRTGIRLMAAGSTPQEIAAALTLRPETLDYFDRTAAPRYEDAILAAIRAQRNLVLVPTPGVPYRTVAYRKQPALLAHPDNFALLGHADRDFILANAKKDLDGPEGPSAEQAMGSLPVKFRQLRRLNLPMAIGSDAGSTLHFPSGAIWWELEAWRALGVAHQEVLVAATERGAHVLRTVDAGRIAVGGRADVILYRGRVDQGPFEMSRVMLVAKDGVRFVAGGRWIEGTKNEE
jgi:cytosine/adenosine deaminase-related metal-dependent hydrolase